MLAIVLGVSVSLITGIAETTVKTVSLRQKLYEVRQIQIEREDVILADSPAVSLSACSEMVGEL